ncbi:MAG: carbohydrate kinase family protein [Thermoplasmata archaeon]
MVDVVGFGALNFDRLFKVERLAKGDTEVHIIDQKGSPGGSAANTIFALGKLGINCGFVGAIGRDHEGEELKQDFERVGVDVFKITTLKDVRTGIVVGFVDKSGERALYVSPGANSELTAEMVDMDYLAACKIAHLSSFVGDDQFNFQKDVIESLAGKVKVSLCPGTLYIDRGLDQLKPMLKKSDFLFMNKAEVEGLTGKEYPEGSRELLGLGCGTVAITLGGEGSFIIDSEGEYSVPAVAKEAVDTTGAGDSFAAGFLYGVLLGKSSEQCGMIGNIIASKCVESIGARTNLPTAEEVQSSADFPK